MGKHPFIVFVDVPEGVTVGEVASHLADAHRMMVRSYSELDPMHGVVEIEVMAGVPISQLPASQVDQDPEEVDNVLVLPQRAAGPVR